MDRLRQTQVSISTDISFNHEVAIAPSGKLVIKDIELSKTIDEIVRDSIVMINNELPEIIFSTTMHTQVYVLDHQTFSNKDKSLNKIFTMTSGGQ